MTATQPLPAQVERAAIQAVYRHLVGTRHASREKALDWATEVVAVALRAAAPLLSAHCRAQVLEEAAAACHGVYLSQSGYGTDDWGNDDEAIDGWYVAAIVAAATPATPPTLEHS